MHNIECDIGGCTPNHTLVSISDMMVMRVNMETNSFTRVTQLKWLRDKMELSKAVLDEQIAYIAGISRRT